MIRGLVVLALMTTAPPITLMTPLIGLCPINPADPCIIEITVRIPPHPDNRAWTLAWGAATGESGSSLHQLDGLSSASLYNQAVRLDRETTYLVEACVYRLPPHKVCDHRELPVR